MKFKEFHLFIKAEAPHALARGAQRMPRLAGCIQTDGDLSPSGAGLPVARSADPAVQPSFYHWNAQGQEKGAGFTRRITSRLTERISTSRVMLTF